jgi:hypothetical protein
MKIALISDRTALRTHRVSSLMHATILSIEGGSPSRTKGPQATGLRYGSDLSRSASAVAG